MENKLALLDLLNRLLGEGSKRSKGNYAYVCPFHVSDPPGKKKLEINVELGYWECWSCGKTNDARGKKIKTLLKKLNAPKEYFDELKLINPTSKAEYTISSNKIILPKEFKSLIDFESTNRLDNVKYKQAMHYLQKRNITQQDIIKYNIGFCISGDYYDRIIIPSYDKDGILNYYIARDFTDNLFNKYKNPDVANKDVIGFELYINWNAPIILVEGIYDAITIKRNVIPLFGKIISNALMKKLVESKVNRIYIALDADANKDAMKYCEELMSYGKEVYLIDMTGKDFNELGFKQSLELLEQTSPLNFQSLMTKKLEKI